MLIKIVKSLALTISCLCFQVTGFSQTINLGILSSFEAYTGAGAITSGAGTIFTGDAGTNIGVISGLGSPPSFNGVTYNADGVTDQCRRDLLRLYIHLNDLFVTYPGTHAPAFGAASNEILTPGVYSIGAAGSIGSELTLDGGGNPNAFFVIKFNGAMTVGANTIIHLTGQTKSCNVFYIADGAISVAAGANIKGTLLAKIGAVGLGVGATLEGRMLSMEGAITTGTSCNVIPPSCASTIPIFCEADCNPAPAVDILGVLSDFCLFTSLGAVGNTSVAGINGHIGTNSGSVSGFTSSIVVGSMYTANPQTAQANLDVNSAYESLNNMVSTATHAAAFGTGETVSPGVYFNAGAGSLSGTLTLDGGGNSDAIFVFKFGGAFSVAALSKIILANGARRCNVFWVGGAGSATGAVTIGAASILKGTFLSHGGACNSGAGTFLAGRQLSTGGAVNTYGGIVYNNPECITSAALPIELLSFTAVATNKNVQINWSTASEINNDYFNIERSSDGINFASISQINGAGNSTQILRYALVDDAPLSRTSYYRLKQTDFDGKKSYSSIVSVRFNNSNFSNFDIYPNPFSGETTFQTTEKLNNATLIVYNGYGREVKQITNISGQTFKMHREDLSNGLYFVNLVQDGKMVATSKIVIGH